MIKVEAKLINARQAIRSLERDRKNANKAEEIAVKVEGFRLRKLLMAEIRAGAPGGERFAPLTALARGLGIRTSRRVRKDRPLIRMANAVTYDAEAGQTYRFHMGFTKRTPAYFVRRAREHQTGFERRISPAMRRFIISEGARRGKIEGGNTPFFLKKSTALVVG